MGKKKKEFTCGNVVFAPDEGYVIVFDDLTGFPQKLALQPSEFTYLWRAMNDWAKENV